MISYHLQRKNHTFTSAMDLYNLACVFGAWCYRILVFTMLIPNINSRFSINNITGKINPKRFLIIDIIIMGIVYVLLRIFHAQEWHLYGNFFR